MKNKEIPVMVDTGKLFNHTLRVTQNLNNFPKKYRYTLVDKILNLSMDIYDNISDANYSRNEKRIEHQEEAIKACRKLKFYLRQIYDVLHPECSMSYWAEMVKKIQDQLINWKAATEKAQKR